jgi:hypothetical protein
MSRMNKTVKSYFDEYRKLKGDIGKNKVAEQLEMPTSTFNHIYNSGKIDFMKFLAIGDKLNFSVLKYFMEDHIDDRINQIKEDVVKYERVVKDLEKKTIQQSQLIDILLKNQTDTNGEG